MHRHAEDRRVQLQVDSTRKGVVRVSQWSGPGADDELIGYGESTEYTRPESRHHRIGLFGIHEPSSHVPVEFRFGLQRRQGLQFVGGPCHQQRAGALDRNARVVRVREQKFVAAPHQSRLQRAGRAVKAGMQNRGVGLACRIADICPCIDKGHLHRAAVGRTARKLSRDGGSDHPGSHHDRVVHTVVGHVDSAISRHCPSMSAARSGDHCGS